MYDLLETEITKYKIFIDSFEKYASMIYVN